MKKSPLETVKAKFKSKEGLIEAVRKLTTDELWLNRVSERKGLEHVSNSRLLRLHGILSEVKAKFGSRSALIEEIQKLQKRAKDAGYRARLDRFPVPRLLDLYRSLSK